MVNFTPWPLCPCRELPHPSNRRLGGPHSRYECLQEKSSALVGIRRPERPSCSTVTVLTELSCLYRRKKVRFYPATISRKEKVLLMQNICDATSRIRTGNCKKIRTGERSNYRRYGSHKQQEKEQWVNALHRKQLEANRQ